MSEALRIWFLAARFCAELGLVQRGCIPEEKKGVIWVGAGALVFFRGGFDLSRPI